MLKHLVFIGAAAQICGSTIYIRETLKGKVKPNKATWLMWAIAPLIASAAAVSDGISLAALPVFMVGFTPVLIL